MFYALTAHTRLRVAFEAKYNFLTIASNFLFLHGLYPPGNNSVVPGGWSIGCEMLFYAAFPFIFYFVNNKAKAIRFVIFSLVVNVLYQIIANKFSNGFVFVENDKFNYFFITNQLPVFGCGIMLYFSLREGEHSSVAKHKLMAWLMIALTFGVWISAKFFGLAFALVPFCAGLLFLNLGLLLSQARLQGWLSNGVAQIGRKSFSIYIFHFIFAWNVSLKLSHFLEVKLAINEYLLYFMALFINIAASYALAVLTHHYVETAGINLGKKLAAAYGKQRVAAKSEP